MHELMEDDILGNMDIPRAVLVGRPWENNGAGVPGLPEAVHLTFRNESLRVLAFLDGSE